MPEVIRTRTYPTGLFVSPSVTRSSYWARNIAGAGMIMTARITTVKTTLPAKPIRASALTSERTRAPRTLLRRRPTLVGVAFAAFLVVDSGADVDLAYVIATAALIYIGAVPWQTRTSNRAETGIPPVSARAPATVRSVTAMRG
jgi:hypothetical protein